MKKVIICFIIFFSVGCAHKNFIKKDNISQPTKIKVIENNISKQDLDKKVVIPHKKILNNKNSFNKSKIVFPRTVDKQIKNGKKEKVDLAFDNVNIYEVINSIVGDILKKDFVISPTVNSKISLKLSGNYSKEELIKVLSKALDISGLSLIRDKNLFKVIRKTDMKKNIKFLDPTNIYTIEIGQLKHLAAYEFIRYIKPFLSNGAVAIAVNSSNSVIIADKKENIANVRRIMTLLDNAIFKGIIFSVVKLNYLTSDEAVKFANNILRSQALFSKSGVLKNVFIAPIKSNNSVLFIARDEELMKMLINWVKEADKPDENALSKVYVVPIANVKSEDLANILKQLYGGKATKTKKGKVIVKGSSFYSGTLSGQVTFIPDKINNLLVIKAAPNDYKIIYDVLKKLDVVPRQVLIDVLIAEVSYSSTLTYGIQWYLRNYGVKINGRSYNGVINLNGGTAVPLNDNVMGSSSLLGFSYALYDKIGGIRGLLNILQTNSKVKILASPSILSVDNKEAKIEIGEEVPIIKQSVTNVNSEGNITNTIEYKNTGVILTVTPQVNPKGLVRLDVKVEVSEAKTNKVSGIDSPIFLKRSADTSLVVYNNQTIVTGGLIKEKKDTSDSGIPILKDIPLLGYLFGGETHNNDRTELVIAITPHIVEPKSVNELFSNEFINRIIDIKHILQKGREKTFNDMQIK